MKYTSIVLMGLGAFMLPGCGSHKSQPGGPGVEKSAAGDHVTESANTFKIDVPHAATHVKQGQSQTLHIGNAVRSPAFSFAARRENTG